ncbi:MAG: S41 family peptidase [Lachnospiraceae bacterium]|nr:S41 family peptidase [Lachnospiraceae bacterium]
MEEQNSNKSRNGLFFFLGFLCGALLLMVACSILIVFLSESRGSKRTRSEDDEQDRQEKLVNEETVEKIELIENSINEVYYQKDVDTEILRDGLYRGMVDALGDPYSVYYTEEEYDEIIESIEGTYSGIGAYLMEGSEYPVITGTIKGSPAEKAGITENDLITAVNGESISGYDLSSVIAIVRGEEGTSVTLTIRRGNETLDVTLERRRIESPTVATEDVQDGIGYLRISEFDEVTPGQFEEGLSNLKAQGMKGLILDLRSNTGGSLDAVCDIARQILPEGVIVYTLDRDGERQDYTCDGKNAADFPIVVLTNGYTASASEILSGAIRDYELGILLGTTTFGKGVVQRIFRLEDGTALKLTVENYFTPSGYNLNGIGLVPDVELEYDPDIKQKEGIDNQRQRAETELRKLMASR